MICHIPPRKATCTVEYACTGREEGRKERKKRREGGQSGLRGGGASPHARPLAQRGASWAADTDVLEKSRTFTISHMGGQRSPPFRPISRLHSKVSISRPPFPSSARLVTLFPTTTTQGANEILSRFQMISCRVGDPSRFGATLGATSPWPLKKPADDGS